MNNRPIQGFLIFLLLIGLRINLSASPIEEVYDTRHNLVVPMSDGSSPCTVCHIDSIPWQSSEDNSKAAQTKKSLPPPLWDKSRTTVSTFQTTQTVPLKDHPYNHPTGPSLVCLACHDGALGTDMHGINVDNPRTGASADLAWTGMAGARTAPPLSRVDHPISILYPRKPNGSFVPINPTVTRGRYWALPDRHAGGLTLPTSDTSSYLDLPQGKISSVENLSMLVRTTGGMMECDSCHNPHSEKVRPFLRVPTQTLCLVCHDR